MKGMLTFGDVCYHRTFDPLHWEPSQSNVTMRVKMEIGIKSTKFLESHQCHPEGRGWGTWEGSCHERANASYPWVPQKELGNTCSAMSPVKAQSHHSFSIFSILIALHLGPQLEPEPDPRGKKSVNRLSHRSRKAPGIWKESLRGNGTFRLWTLVVTS